MSCWSSSPIQEVVIIDDEKDYQEEREDDNACSVQSSDTNAPSYCELLKPGSNQQMEVICTKRQANRIVHKILKLLKIVHS